MKVALVHHRAGLMDGVSLEMEKWKKALESLGARVSIVAGNESNETDVVLPFLAIESDEDDVDSMERELKGVLSDFDWIVIENIWSLALRIPVGLALEGLIGKVSARFVGHHHDFWWERGVEESEILRKHFPPNGIKHVVINTIAKEELFKRRGFDSFVVPNVIDLDEFENLNQGVREMLGIPEDAVVALQATRVVRRKAIELSVRLVSELRCMAEGFKGERLYDGRVFSGKVILVMGGMVEDRDYMERLEKLAQDLNVEMVNAYHLVESGKVRFWDVYSVADFVTYPSVLEGWGNQLLETLAAKKPVVLFEYEVFKKDIKPSGIRYVSLGDRYGVRDGFVEIEERRMKEAAHEILRILFDADEYSKMVSENLEIIKRRYSLEALRGMLEEIFRR